MKRITAIALLFFYFLTTNGISFNINYCCGKVSSVSFGASADRSCRQTKKMPNCCGHKQVYAKLNVPTLASPSHQITNPTVAIPLHTNHVAINLASSHFSKVLATHSPPPPDRQPAYLVFHSILV